MKSVLKMDIFKGDLDDISRPASMSRSRPGSRISSSLQAEEMKIVSTLGSLEVLTQEMCLSELRELTSDDGQETLKDQNPEDHLKDRSLKNYIVTQNSDQERVSENLKPKETEESDFSKTQVGGEHKVDPRLEKAIKKMKALDEILLKRIAKEKEVVAQSNIIKKQMWEELQSVSKYSLSRSLEENVNTNTFLALTSQLDNTAGESSVFEKSFLPVFSTQLLLEDCDDDDNDNEDDDELKTMPDKAFGMENSERDIQKAKQKKCKEQRKGVDFIQRNIELVKEAGSHFFFMDDEKLRLQQLLADIQDGCSDDDVTTDVSLCLVPDEGFTPEPEELLQLANIEAQLRMFCSTTEINDCDDRILPKHFISEVSPYKSGNSVPAPGEQVLRYTKELREQKIRLKEIDEQLQNMEQSSTTPLSISCFSSVLSESSLII